jgi:hypothetical protein
MVENKMWDFPGLCTRLGAGGIPVVGFVILEEINTRTVCQGSLRFLCVRLCSDMSGLSCYCCSRLLLLLPAEEL